MEGFNEKLNQYKLPIGLLLVGGVLLVGGLFSSNLIQKKPEAVENFPKESIVSQSSLNDVKVDVAGAVNSPGVFSLSKESRIEDAIKLAGGFNANVDREFVAAKLNLAQKVSDGLKIYIPFEGDERGTTGITGTTSTTGSVVAGVSAATVSGSGKIGINSADQASLETLPGVGPVTAKKIIDNRPYAEVGELLSKKAVSKSVYTKILDLVDLN
jgi:competence protein ComEA